MMGGGGGKLNIHGTATIVGVDYVLFGGITLHLWNSHHCWGRLCIIGGGWVGVNSPYMG